MLVWMRRASEELPFEEWAESIALRVVRAIPGVNLKRKFDDVYRWIHLGRECQVHALSDSRAAFLALGGGKGGLPLCPVCDQVAICRSTEENIASRIIEWFS
jgi:hypothetical protein